ncbi:MAG TPA: hypothetical protein PK006_01420 [Saprospiraceae bacterium]|nr:hypothetical protein [Saprospiraceae bacterium]
MDNGLSFQPVEWKPTNYSLVSDYTIPDKVSFLFFENNFTDLLYCYRSTANQKDWELRATIHDDNLKGLAHYASDEDNIYAYGFSSPLVYHSKDGGKSWSIDDHFKDMRGIVDMFIVKDTIWVSGIDVNGDWGVFKAAPGESLKLMTNYPKNYLMAFETSLYPTVIVNDGLNGPYISTDGGNSLRDFNEGLPKDSFHLYLSGKQVLIDGYYYLPVLSRGLYKTAKIISKTQDKAQLEGELFYVRNNPSQAYFRILYNPNLKIKR